MSIIQGPVYVMPPWFRLSSTWTERDREVMSKRHEEARQRVFAMWKRQREQQQ